MPPLVARPGVRADEDLRVEVAALRRSHDDTRHHNEQRRQRIAVLREHIARIEHQRAIAQKDVPHTSTTQELESAIAQMGRKLEEADETRLMYLQMIARLKGESTFFNRDLSRLKAATNAKEQDEVELQLMLKDATYARNDAKQRCHEVEQATHAEERRRAKELARREQQLEQRRQQCAEHESACAARRHELLVAQEQAHASIERTIRNPSTIDEELAQIHQYEEEFKKMQNMAGASEVQDIISKFLRQEDTYNMLTMMTRDSHLRIGASKEAKAEAHAAVERLRYEGVGEEEDAPSGRHASAVTSLVDFGADSAAAARTWSSQHDSRLRRTARTLIDVRAGVQHLVDLLASSQALDLEEFNGSLDGDDTLVAGLQYVSRNITRLVQSTSDPVSELRVRREPGRGVEVRREKEAAVEEKVFLLTTKADNFRLAGLREPVDDDDDDDDDDNELGKNTVLSSVDVKEQSGRLVVRHTKPKRRRGKAAADDDADVRPHQGGAGESV